MTCVMCARTAPAPPAGDRAHRYVPAVHALDVAQLELTANESPAYVGFHTLARLRGHVRIADPARATAAAAALVLRNIRGPLVAVKLEAGADASL